MKKIKYFLTIIKFFSFYLLFFIKDIFSYILFIINKPKLSFKNKKLLLFLQGKYYGYNDCCIESFYKKLTKENLQYQTKEFFGSGFVPCESCLQSKSAETIRNEINKKRVHDIPFDTGLNTEENIKISLIKNSNKFSDNDYVFLSEYLNKLETFKLKINGK